MHVGIMVYQPYSSPILHGSVQVSFTAMNENKFIVPVARVVIAVELAVHPNGTFVQALLVP